MNSIGASAFFKLTVSCVWPGRSVIKIFDVTLQKYGYFYGYNSSVNPSIANSFASAAFRFGHSLVNSKLSRCDKFGNHMNLGENQPATRGHHACTLICGLFMRSPGEA